MKFLNKHIHNIYFLGIGGIGMSALARYFHYKGIKVKGYDRTESIVTRGLEKLGIEIFYMLDASHIEGIDLMVYTPAISRDCVEYVAAEKAGIPILKRSEVLGIISKEYRTLAVAGTHGKTTTSTMLAHLLRETGADCTAFLGGISNNLKSNFAFGDSDLMVVEADEFDRSFLTLHPFISIITSMDPDHLDIYGSEAEMQRNYFQFAGQSQNLLVEAEMAGKEWPKEVETFGIDTGDFQAKNLRFEALSTVFDFHHKEIEIKDIALHLPGRHNVKNMLSAMAMAIKVGVEPKKLGKAVSTFSGIYRRFEVMLHSEKLTFVDDYAHHPTEISAAIETARKLFPDRQLVVVFQPHLYSRTRDFYEGFAEELDKADVALLMDIYPAREAPIPGVSSEMILKQMHLKEKMLVSKKGLPAHIMKVTQPPTVLLTLGAGDIDKEVTKIKVTIEQES